MLSVYEAAEASEDVPGSLHWRERSDGHWIATSPLGGHYELVPKDGSIEAWKMPLHATPVHLGTSATLGGAMMLSRRDLRDLMYPAKDNPTPCGHTHPPSVPTAPCDEPPSPSATVDVARVTVERSRMTAREAAGRRSSSRSPSPRRSRKVDIACEHAGHALGAKEAGPYATSERDPKEIEEARALGPATSPKAVYAMVAPDLSKESQEVFLVIPVDLRGQPLSKPVEIARGQRDHVAVSKSDIYRPVIEKNAMGFILVHVHPSGHAKPSAEDIRLTRSVDTGTRHALEDVKFVDHVIVAASATRGEYFSFRENGYLGRSRPRRTPLIHRVVH